MIYTQANKAEVRKTMEEDRSLRLGQRVHQNLSLLYTEFTSQGHILRRFANVLAELVISEFLVLVEVCGGIKSPN